jgi:hypothetical protein
MESVFGPAFDRPATFRDPERGQLVLTRPFGVGAIDVPSGRLAIQDPAVELTPDTLDRTIPPGAYPVDLALRSWTAEDGAIIEGALIAAARIAIRSRPAVRFVPVRASAGLTELAVDVDSRLISVFDRSSLAALAGTSILDAVGASAPEWRPDVPFAYIVAAPGGGTIFVCESGKGDGRYRAWWGLAGDDEIVELVVDFGELEYSLWRTVEFPASAILGSAARLRLALAGTGLELEPVPAESLGIPIPPGTAGSPGTGGRYVALRRPAGPRWELRLLDASGALVGSPGQAQLIPGPWFEVFERVLVERASTVRVRIHGGRAPLVLEA